MKRIYVSLSNKSIENAIKELEKYRDDLKKKLEIFVVKLIQAGIATAEINEGEYKGMITFRPANESVFPLSDGVEGILIATDGVKLIKEWKYQGGIKQAEVSPLLMAEFGSGWLSKVLDPVEGVGQGTFPGEKHAFDVDGWWWTTPDGENHHSYGEAPTYPVHSALFAMMFQIESIAREVFNGELVS